MDWHHLATDLLSPQPILLNSLLPVHVQDKNKDKNQTFVFFWNKCRTNKTILFIFCSTKDLVFSSDVIQNERKLLSADAFLFWRTNSLLLSLSGKWGETTISEGHVPVYCLSTVPHPHCEHYCDILMDLNLLLRMHLFLKRKPCVITRQAALSDLTSVEGSITEFYQKVLATQLWNTRGHGKLCLSQ